MVVVFAWSSHENPSRHEKSAQLINAGRSNRTFSSLSFTISTQESDSKSIMVVMWVFPKIVVSQNGSFIMENPINMDDFLGYPYFWKHPCTGCTNCTFFRFWGSPRRLACKNGCRSRIPLICSRRSKTSSRNSLPGNPISKFCWMKKMSVSDRKKTGMFWKINWLGSGSMVRCLQNKHMDKCPLCKRICLYSGVNACCVYNAIYVYFGHFLWKLNLVLEILFEVTESVQNTCPLRNSDTIVYHLSLLHCCWCFPFMCSQFSSLLRHCLF